ncbi:DNA mismatch repair protein MutS [Dehalogenimonas alkenigignens]|uniref:DNA mismatch repair protein MutS n=1 Tax=Dehalogenimonas alkenigignens TaxID=1217799 RepID=A0A0W0GHW0_9CHLR|nr:DNA mismatch repair protein MutS [Dehalogenimonas alkenigignens]KTB48141.1 DNA mismatch repair protein MutS [Dehalogenimonas alkenigignens]PVV84381.1 DNA mismatch repair protein MutS [Dehalogenimonas alkenigignens]
MTENLTPLRAQYLRIKKRYPDSIVFFRLGDFYETFDSDAELAARELEIVLTAREMGKGIKVPMAGIPYHAAENYIARLIGRGYKIAVCEQTTRPGEIKGLMEREVVRVVTPGTIVEPALLNVRINNYLASIAPGGTSCGLAYIDISTGEFAAAQIPAERLETELGRIHPAELILPTGAETCLSRGMSITELDPSVFEPESAADTLKAAFRTSTLEGYNLENQPLAIAAAGAIITYLRETNQSALGVLSHISNYSTAEYMALDDNTLTNLEVFQNATTGGVRGSLLGIVDRTKTAMGARMLRRWLGKPLLSRQRIMERQACVEALRSQHLKLKEIEKKLKQVADVERVANRIKTLTAMPRELIALKRSLETVPELACALEGEALKGLRGGLNPLPDLVRLIHEAIEPEPAASPGEGGVIRAGFSVELDKITDLAANSRLFIAQLEATERSQTGIKTLKVGFNQVFGYYLEVSNPNLSQVPIRYIRKQTLANAERFITPELKELELRVLSSKERLADLETSLYRRVLQQIGQSADSLLSLAEAIARVDVLSALASMSVENAYVKPIMVDGPVIKIVGGRHPVIEQTLDHSAYVPNDIDLETGDSQIIILTGPNMAGKSTYLKQVAIIVLMAQIGSFIPATSAEIGICDRIFTRIGAREDLVSGKSTFMAEMVETALILSSATSSSLLILDEIGRGTSTSDGLAIAQAVVEFIHQRLGARTLFATHYHELISMAERLPRVRNFNVAVTEDKGEVIFLHRIQPGGTDRSYGIHVAKIAGLPKPVVRRANEILAELENLKTETPASARPVSAQLSFLNPPSPAIELIRGMDPDSLTPRKALEMLYTLKQMLE